MFAVVEVGNSQFQVAQGDVINVQRLDLETGKTIDLEKVVLFVDGDDVRIGQPYVKGVTVSAKIIGESKTKKVLAFKYRKRKDSSSQRGHRQTLTALSITKISG
ncbi:MAG: 50S ribosomal protein L21 [Candidatus Omnitrophica bacterium]|nr:50S ribosomal protein L21 [Candidatus Omnitrophota bacterium]